MGGKILNSFKSMRIRFFFPKNKIHLTSGGTFTNPRACLSAIAGENQTRISMCQLCAGHIGEEFIQLCKRRVGVESSWSSLWPDTECLWERTILPAQSSPLRSHAYKRCRFMCCIYRSIQPSVMHTMPYKCIPGKKGVFKVLVYHITFDVYASFIVVRIVIPL